MASVPVWRLQIRSKITLAALVGITTIGCGSPTPTGADGANAAPTNTTANGVTVVTPVASGGSDVGAPGAGPVSIQSKVDQRYTQTFAEATVDEVPDGMQLPVDRTLAGKSTGTLRDAVEQEWTKIPLVSVNGTPLKYVATVTTTQGSFDIALRPDLAPNHVRNFIALSKIGYYDGLLVDRLVHQEAMAEDGTKTRLDLMKLGCPKGTGEDGLGHIGYFLQPEFTDVVNHELGTIGFWHEDLPQSAGTRLYITLGAAPALDRSFSIFGKVSAGLDVVQKIATQPTQSATMFPEIETPMQSVTIQKVTIGRDDVEIPAGVDQNKR